jgi:hypothetical protein
MKRLLIMLLALVVSGCSTRLEGLDDLAYVGMQFTLNNSATFAGGGYSTNENPHLPLDNASNEVPRDWSTRW